MVATVSKSLNAAQAASYHNHDDYYFKERGPSYYSGKTAELLGLAGKPVEQALFKDLLAGRIPTALLNPNLEVRNERYYSHQSDPRGPQQSAGNGMRCLSECSMAVLSAGQGTNAPGVLHANACPARPDGPDFVRRTSAAGTEVDQDTLKALKLQEFLKIHKGGKTPRAGNDITFSAPKSFSIAALTGCLENISGEDLIEIQKAAVAETFEEIEKQAGGRYTEDKITQEIVTGNYLISNFNHSTSRPVTLAQVEALGPEYAALAARMRAEGKDFVVDPNIHTHSVVLNVTWDATAQRFRAIDNNPLFRDQTLINSIYHNALARRLREAGVALRDFSKDGVFELAAVDQKIVDQFSLRSATIEKLLGDAGLTRETASAKQLEMYALKTRNAKNHGVDRNELFTGWKDRLAEVEKSAGCSIKAAEAAGYAEEHNHITTARDGIESGLAHHMERASVVKEADVKRWALNNSRGQYGMAQINATMAEMKASGELLFGHLATDRKSPGAQIKATAFKEAEATIDMRNFAQTIAAQKGLELPEGKTFEAYRLFLDEHAPKKLGLKEDGEAPAVRAVNARPGEMVLTTRAAQKREQTMIESVKHGLGTMPAIMTKAESASIIDQRTAEMREKAFAKALAAGATPKKARKEAKKLGLNPGQREVAELILTSKNRVNVVLGVAGSGKSFTLGQAKEIIEEQAAAMGLKIHGVAPSHQAKNELIEVTGKGDTLQSFLTNPKEWGKLDKKSLLIVDEAGMASTKQMAELERISAKQGFRYFLVGDLRQTAAVEAGKPLKQIAAVTSKAEMNVSVRHKDKTLAESAALAADGRMAESIDKINVTEIASASERRKQIAERFMSISNAAESKARGEGKTEQEIKTAGEAARKETLLLSTTNDARKEINNHVRAALGLAGTGTEINTLRQKDTSAESRKFLDTYQPGDVIQFAAAYKSFGAKSGDRYSVVEAKSDRLIIESSKGERFDFQPARYKSEQWGVYTADKIEMAVGDRVRLRENSKEFKNGDWGNVVAIDGQTIQIASERYKDTTWTIKHAERALCIDHGYCMTAHGAQGATKDRTLVDMDSKSPTLASETAYVMNTRSRWELDIFTDSKAKLPAAISKATYKPNALDFEKMTDQPAKYDLHFDEQPVRAPQVEHEV